MPETITLAEFTRQKEERARKKHNENIRKIQRKAMGEVFHFGANNSLMDDEILLEFPLENGILKHKIVNLGVK